MFRHKVLHCTGYYLYYHSTAGHGTCLLVVRAKPGVSVTSSLEEKAAKQCKLLIDKDNVTPAVTYGIPANSQVLGLSLTPAYKTLISRQLTLTDRQFLSPG